MRRLAPALAAGLLLLPDPAAAAEPVAPIVRTEVALRYLLGASALSLPRSSPCAGVIAGVPLPRFGDYLAIAFSGLDGGANRVWGGCDRERCRIQITHAAGEDVYSYDYRFRVARGKLVPASLTCFSTP